MQLILSAVIPELRIGRERREDFPFMEGVSIQKGPECIEHRVA
jgi:hypothetical protein